MSVSSDAPDGSRGSRQGVIDKGRSLGATLRMTALGAGKRALTLPTINRSTCHRRLVYDTKAAHFSRALLKLFLSGIIPFVGAATLWSLALSVYALHSGKELDGFQRTPRFRQGHR